MASWELKKTILRNLSTLKLYCRFESGLLTTDETGVHTLTALGGGGSEVAGVYGGGVRLTKASTQGYSITDSSDFDFTTAESFSISVWLKENGIDPTTEEHVVSKYTGGGTAGWYLRVDNSTGYPRMVLYPTTTEAVGNVNVADNAWHHVVAVRDVATDKVYLYIDGKISSVVTDNTTGDSSNANPVYIGCFNNSANWYNGEIDELAVYDQALTADQVKELYEGRFVGELMPSSATKLLMDLNGSSTDRSGNNNHGVDTSMVYGKAYGKINQGGQFGSGRKITTPATTSLDVDNITVIALVYFTGTNANDMRIAIRDNEVGSGRLWIFSTIGTNTVPSFLAWNEAGTLYQAIDGANISQNAWHLVCATWDGSFIRRYVDGQPYGTNLAVTGNLRKGAIPCLIGNDQLGNNRHIVGNIDEVAIINGAMSQSFMAKLYASIFGKLQ